MRSRLLKILFPCAYCLHLFASLHLNIDCFFFWIFRRETKIHHEQSPQGVPRPWVGHKHPNPQAATNLRAMDFSLGGSQPSTPLSLWEHRAWAARCCNMFVPATNSPEKECTPLRLTIGRHLPCTDSFRVSQVSPTYFLQLRARQDRWNIHSGEALDSVDGNLLFTWRGRYY